MICGCSPDGCAAGERKVDYASMDWDLAGPGYGSHHEQLLAEVAGHDSEKWHRLFGRGKRKTEAQRWPLGRYQ